METGRWKERMVSLMISAGAVYPQSQINAIVEDGRERAEAIMTEEEPIDTPDKISFFPGKRFAA